MTRFVSKWIPTVSVPDVHMYTFTRYLYLYLYIQYRLERFARNMCTMCSEWPVFLLPLWQARK